MVHSQTPQPLSVKPSENLTWKMRWISWISLGLNFQYPWLFWWCDFPTEIKFRWTWEHWTSSSPPTMTGRSINALSNTWPNFFHLKFQVKMVEFASAWDVWIPSEELRQGPNTSKSAKDMSQSLSSSLMMKTWNKKNMNHKMPVLFVCYADFEFSTEGIETWEKKTRKEFYKWIWETRAFRTSPLLCKRESEKEVWYEANRETQKDWRLRSCKIIRHSSWERCKKYLPYPSGLSRQVKIPRISRTPKRVTCEKEFFDEDDENPIIRDHCHFSGRFRGAAIWNSRSQRRFLLSFTTSPKNQIERES